jgi:nuclear RNA export factor
VSMDGPAGGRGKVGKSTAKPSRRGGRNGDVPSGGILSATAQRHILRQAANGDVNMKPARPSARTGLVELKITNWEKSSSCTSKDRGVSSLITWLEKKASRKLGSSAGRREVRIRKVRQPHTENPRTTCHHPVYR